MKNNTKIIVKSSTDNISSTLVRIRNAIASGKSQVVVLKTKMNLEILNILLNYKFIKGYFLTDDRTILVDLLIDGVYKINELKVISKPGLRVYVKAPDIRLVKGGKGLGIISTSKGVLSNVQARKMNIGGEYICQIW